MVHWTQPNFMAIPENDSHGDSCGPIALLDYLHIFDGRPLTVAEVNAIRSELINMHLMGVGSGMTMQEIRAAAEHYKIPVIKFVDFNASLNFGAFRDDIIAALEAEQYVLIEWANAQALPDNQVGVQYHFTGLWGIDSTLGYYMANGDTYTALRNGDTPVNPEWTGIGSFQAARPCGYIIFGAVHQPQGNNDMIVLEKDSAGNVTGAHDEKDTSLHLGQGMAYAVEQQNLLNDSIIRGETYISADQSIATLGGDAVVLLYTANHGTDVYHDLNLRNAVNVLLDSATRPTVNDSADPVVTQAITILMQDVAALVTATQNVQGSANAVQAAQQKD